MSVQQAQAKDRQGNYRDQGRHRQTERKPDDTALVREQVGYLCEAGEKIILLLEILLKGSPRTCGVFCNSKEGEEYVKKYLQRLGLISTQGTSSRVAVYCDASFKGKQQRYACVVNFDLPYTPHTYATRLQAVEHKGHCISMLCDYYSDFAPPIIAAHPLSCKWSPYDLRKQRSPSRQAISDWLAATAKSKPRRQPKPTAKHADKTKTNQYQRHASRRVTNAHHPPKHHRVGVGKNKSVWEKILSFFATKDQ